MEIEMIETPMGGDMPVTDTTTGDAIANRPAVSLGCVANMFCRQMHFRKSGSVECGHKHAHDHLTLLAAGSMRVTVEGQSTEFTAPHMIYIHADKQHELVALEDNTVAYCIHALRTGDGVDDILDPAMVPSGVDPRTMCRSVLK
jgi:quercetin dioxygenase-like cupin family protein